MNKHKHGGDIYSQPYRVDYSANINPLGPPSGVLRALVECGRQIQNYPDVSQRRLRKALASCEGVQEDWLTFGNGAAELIYGLCLGLCPKRALLVMPTFAEYEEALEAAGCEIIFYELQKENGYQIGADYLDYVTEDLDMLFLCNPNNPTGTLTERSLLEQIAKKCQNKQVLMVVDECFNAFLDEPERYSMKKMLRDYPNLFLLNAFTKLYAMPGLRLGYGICTNSKVRECIKRVQQPWSISIPAQEAGIAALKEQDYVRAGRELIRRERQVLEEGLRKLGFQVVSPAANYLFFQGRSGLALACQQQGYLIRDCSNYRGLGEGCYRIAVRTKEENEAFLEVLERIVKGESKSWQKQS